MHAPPIDLARKIKDILKHVEQLPEESNSPILHYKRTIADTWSLLTHVEKAFNTSDRPQTVVDRHFGHLCGMVLVNIVETFERFLKEVAAECVDRLANFITDDRFNAFTIQASSLASHFNTGTLGKSLCESSTWLDCSEINNRFRRLLSDPFDPGKGQFNLFPTSNQQPADERWRTESMNLAWQIRHTAVHNVGVITRSDAVKLRLLAKEPVDSPRMLMPNRSDLTYLKSFIDETAGLCNDRIGERLAEILTVIHTNIPSLFNPKDMANQVISAFQKSVQIAGMTGIVPAN